MHCVHLRCWIHFLPQHLHSRLFWTFKILNCLYSCLVACRLLLFCLCWLIPVSGITTTCWSVVKCETIFQSVYRACPCTKKTNEDHINSSIRLLEVKNSTGYLYYETMIGKKTLKKKNIYISVIATAKRDIWGEMYTTSHNQNIIIICRNSWNNFQILSVTNLSSFIFIFWSDNYCKSVMHIKKVKSNVRLFLLPKQRGEENKSGSCLIRSIWLKSHIYNLLGAQ